MHPGRLFVITSQKDAKDASREVYFQMKSVLINLGGWEVSEIKIENKSYLKQQIEKLVPKEDFNLQTPCLFINSKYIGTLADLEQIPEKELKYMLLEAKIQEPGPLYEIYRSQNHIVQVQPPKLFFPPETKHKFTSHVLKITNLMDEAYVVFKMRTNNAKPYSVHPKQGLISPHQEILVTVHLKEEYEASAKDKFRFEGVTIPYADESYVHEIDTIFKKMKDKTVKQMIPLELEKRPEGVIMEERDDKIHIEWKGEGEETGAVEPAVVEDTTTVDESHTEEAPAAPVEEKAPVVEEQKVAAVQETPAPVVAEKPASAVTATTTVETKKELPVTTAPTVTKPVEKVETKKEPTKPAPAPVVEKPAPVTTQPAVSTTTSTKSTERFTTTTHKEPSTPVRQQQAAQEDAALQQLSEQTKKAVATREQESQQVHNEEKQIQLKAYESLKRDYNKALEEIKANSTLIKTLEVDKKKALKEVEDAREQLLLLQEKFRQQQEDTLRQRKNAQSATDSDSTEASGSRQKAPGAASNQLSLNSIDLERGYPLMLVCVIAIVCFLLGNVLGG